LQSALFAGKEKLLQIKNSGDGGMERGEEEKYKQNSLKKEAPKSKVPIL